MEWPLVGRGRLLEASVETLRAQSACLLLDGDLGVGKTRLAHAVAERLGSEGWHVESCAVGPASAAVPLGAFARFVPQPPPADVLLTLEQTRRRILSSADNAPLLLVIDAGRAG